MNKKNKEETRDRPTAYSLDISKQHLCATVRSDKPSLSLSYISDTALLLFLLTLNLLLRRKNYVPTYNKAYEFLRTTNLPSIKTLASLF